MEQTKRKFLKSAGLAAAGIGLMPFISVTDAFADKASVTIEAPESVPKGGVITITINVNHNANNFLHYTTWLFVKVNGEEIARWDYTWRKRPAGGNFTKQITYTLKNKAEIMAEASCNIHGSKGPATVYVKVQA